MPKFKIYWTYQGYSHYDEGILIITAKNTRQAEKKFYKNNTPNRGPDSPIIGYQAESIEDYVEEDED